MEQEIAYLRGESTSGSVRTGWIVDESTSGSVWTGLTVVFCNFSRAELGFTIVPIKRVCFALATEKKTT